MAYYGHSYVAMPLYIEFRNQSQKFILDSNIQSPNPYYQLEWEKGKKKKGQKKEREKN